MPRQVDYDERRRRIADAVCALIAASGMEAVSLRDVAARARVSMGAVQRCFRTKDEMLLFAVEHVADRVGARAKARVAAEAEPRSASALLERTLCAIALPDPEDRTDAQVWLAFVAHAAVSAPLAAVLRETYTQLHDLLVWLIGYGQDTGEFHADADAADEARALLALADGLTAHVVVGHHTPDAAHALLRRHAARLRAAP
ncbi:TetR/AcrR family transcriptional regulator [Streptomyces sp. G45]|uniref:TetR/AcrR family transcriptional regulator n=1 Tax=Streptomyces sp. G45 TaxID=3406627 RepID=UPI003C202911